MKFFAPSGKCSILPLGALCYALLQFAAPGPVTHAAEPKVKKVLFIGIDGCRPDALLAADAPHLKQLIATGAFSDQAQTGELTVSGPSWSSALCGVWAGKHGVTNNNFAPARYGEYPNVLVRLKTARPMSYVASAAHWEPIRSKMITTADHTSAHRSGAEVTAAACKLLDEASPDLLFLHFDDVDHAGHSTGYGPQFKPYLAAIHGVDAQIGQVLAALRRRPAFGREDWLIALTTDHGGSQKGHGKNTPAHRTIFVILHGSSIQPGQIDPAPNIVDLLPTLLEHLEVTIDPGWKLDGKSLATGRRGTSKTRPR
jgi:predicted AlkP superfamily pyrophosphatase or phosphodiesterase